ncbi:MAG: hypothetical protein IH987_11960, partial [Planctomycetes bacterium]|nr:hypothetical protein [Planctomycetota bacterium]
MRVHDEWAVVRHPTPSEVESLEESSIDMVVSTQGDMEIVGEASGGAEALREYARLQPDLVLMDLQMAEMSGL